MKILILTGEFGMGHKAAAQALAAKIRRQGGEYEVEIVDFCAEALAGLHSLVYFSYDNVIAKNARLFNTLYRKKTALKPAPLKGEYRHLFYFLHCLDRLLDERRPDAVISTYSYCSYLMAVMKKTGRTSLPLCTCITDLHSHGVWLNGYTDFYLVADEQTKGELLRYGIDGGKIAVSGIPVQNGFAAAPPRAAGAQKELLVMGGGLGLLPENVGFYQRLSQIENLHITVVTAKNKRLYRKIHGKFANITVLGYVRNVPELMQKADALLSKPGGMTIFEAVHAGLPLLIFEPKLEQEKQNARFLRDNRLGIVLSSKQGQAVRQISLIMHDERFLPAIKANMAAKKDNLREDAVFDFLEKQERKVS